MKSVCISEHLSDSRQHSLLDFPVGKINGWDQSRFPGLWVVRGVLPHLPFLHDSPESAMLLVTNYMPYIGQFLLSKNFIVCCLHDPTSSGKRVDHNVAHDLDPASLPPSGALDKLSPLLSEVRFPSKHCYHALGTV